VVVFYQRRRYFNTGGGILPTAAVFYQRRRYFTNGGGILTPDDGIAKFRTTALIPDDRIAGIKFRTTE